METKFIPWREALHRMILIAVPDILAKCLIPVKVFIQMLHSRLNPYWLEHLSIFIFTRYLSKKKKRFVK